MYSDMLVVVAGVVAFVLFMGTALNCLFQRADGRTDVEIFTVVKTGLVRRRVWRCNKNGTRTKQLE